MDTAEAIQTLRRLDGWKNVLAGFGTSRDKRMAGGVGDLIRPDFETLVDLYRGDPWAARIVDRPAKAMVREWFEVQIADEKDNGEALDQWLKKIKAKAAFSLALQYEGAFGGSGIILGINQGRVEDPAKMAQPLQPDEIDTIDHLVVYAAKELQAVAYYADPMLPSFGMPAAYRVVPRVPFAINGQQVVSFGAKQIVQAGTPTHPWAELPEIHESRILVFPGIVVDRRQRLENWGWGDGRLQRCWEVLRDFGISWAAASNLLTDFAQATLAIPGLLEMLAQDDGKKILQRAQLLDLTRSVCRMVLLDGGDVGTGAGAEVFKREVTPLNGVPDLLEKFMLQMAGAADMPMTVLMGQAPAGMNATGESDTRNWYDNVAELQEERATPPAERLVTLGMMAKSGPMKGRVPKLWSVDWRPLWQMGDAEEATMRKTMADADVAYIDRGVLQPDEVRRSRFGGDKYQIETQLDVEEEKTREAFVDTDPAEGDPASKELRDPTALAAGDGEAAGKVSDKLQELALNGTQISGLLAIISQIRAGDLEGDAAVIALCVSFPFSFDEEKAKKLVEAIEVKEPPPPPDPLELAKAKAAGLAGNGAPVPPPAPKPIPLPPEE